MPHSWPALIIAVVVSVYWGRVLQMVRRARKAAGHDANFVPREKLGRLLRYIWMPVVGLWVVLPYIEAFLSPKHRMFLMRPVFRDNVIPWLAAGLGAVALVATFVCWTKMGTSWRMGINPGDKTKLISTGPFAYIRHPIYALSSLLMIFTMIVVPSPLMMTAGGLHLLLLQWEARREEKYLLRVHGDEYRAYTDRTGRFMPRLFHRPLTV